MELRRGGHAPRGRWRDRRHRLGVDRHPVFKLTEAETKKLIRMEDELHA